MSTQVLRPSPLSRFYLHPRPFRGHARPPHHHHRYSSTSTTTTPSEPPTTLTAARILPYPALSIFRIISDIPSYPSFLPFITSAQILSASARPDSHTHTHWPASATLTVGYNSSISESFTSRVYCVPPVPHRGRAGVGFVEAVSGSDAPPPSFTADEEVGHYDLNVQKAKQEKDTPEGPLNYLRTRWTVHEYPHKPAPGNAKETHDADLESPKTGEGTETKEMTNVSLVVEYRFKNVVYEMMGKAGAGKVAEGMIAAFEKRCEDLLGGGKRRVV